MTSRGKRVGVGIAVVLVLAASGIVGFWWASPDYEPYASPAARTLEEYGAATKFACPDSEVLGGGLRAPLSDVTSASTDDEVAASVQRVVGAPAFRDDDRAVVAREAALDGYRVIGVPGEDDGTYRVAVLIGPGGDDLAATSIAVGDDDPGGAEPLAVFAVGFCPAGRS